MNQTVALNVNSYAKKYDISRKEYCQVDSAKGKRIFDLEFMRLQLYRFAMKVFVQVQNHVSLGVGTTKSETTSLSI